MRTTLVKSAWSALLLWALAAPPAHAEIRILSSPGGQVGPFLDLFEGIRQTGERVVIDGPCLSACTLVLSAVPNDRICVTRRAVLGFHGARSLDRRGRFFNSSRQTLVAMRYSHARNEARPSKVSRRRHARRNVS